MLNVIDDIEIEFVNTTPHVLHYECTPCGLRCYEANLCPWCFNRMGPVFANG